MANGWTSRRRALQAQLIRRWKPWRRATGPRTIEGKSRSAQNALKFGGHTAAAIAERRELQAFLTRLPACRDEAVERHLHAQRHDSNARAPFHAVPE